MPEERSVMKEYRQLDAKRRTAGLSTAEEARFAELRDLVDPLGTPLTPGFDVNAAATALRDSLAPAGMVAPDAPSAGEPAPIPDLYPAYDPSGQAFDVSAQPYDPGAAPFDPSLGYDPTAYAAADPYGEAQPCDPSAPAFDPAQPFDGAAYDPSAQPYDPSAPPYDPAAQPYDPAAYAVDDPYGQAQPYDPNAPAFDPAQPFDGAAYDPSAQPYDPAAPAFDPNAQAFDPGAPGYDAAAAAYDPNASAYDPNAPAFDPAAYDPSAPYDPNAPFDPNAYDPLAPIDPLAPVLDLSAPADPAPYSETSAGDPDLAAPIELVEPVPESDLAGPETSPWQVSGTGVDLGPPESLPGSSLDWEDTEPKTAGFQLASPGSFGPLGEESPRGPELPPLELDPPAPTEASSSDMALGEAPQTPLEGEPASWPAAIETLDADSYASVQQVEPVEIDFPVSDDPATAFAPETVADAPAIPLETESDLLTETLTAIGDPVTPFVLSVAAHSAARPKDAPPLDLGFEAPVETAAPAAFEAAPVDPEPTGELAPPEIPIADGADILEVIAPTAPAIAPPPPPLASPPPPRAEAEPAPRPLAEAVVPGSHRVVVHTVEGQVKRGVLEDGDLLAPEIALVGQAGGAPDLVATGNVKAIFFMLAPGEKPPPPEGKKVRVTFKDGRQVAGFSPDYAQGKAGFFMMPADTRTSTQRIWVYMSAVRAVSAT